MNTTDAQAGDEPLVGPPYRTPSDPRCLTAGSVIGIKFTYWDGATSHHGSWMVPKDHEYRALDELGESLGHAILYEISKQPTRTVAKVEIIRWKTRHD